MTPAEFLTLCDLRRSYFTHLASQVAINKASCKRYSHAGAGSYRAVSASTDLDTPRVTKPTFVVNAGTI